jgi:hypothetical protein
MAEQTDEDNTYVTNAAWVRHVGRPDAVDDVADQFERPVAPGMTAFWSADAGNPWPRSSRGWRSMERMHARPMERRAG